MQRFFGAAALAACLVEADLHTVAQQGPGASVRRFSDPGWALSGDAAVERVDGRETLAIGTGWAHRRGERFEDGTIAFDVQLTRRRSFVYAAFRMADDLEYEELYLRPHKSSMPDAVQYAPVYQGHSAWQLYHGAGATAPVAFQPGVWTPVRIVVQRRRAALFVGGSDAPALVVPRLGHDPRPGGIALRAFTPPGTPGEGPVARFANLQVSPGLVPVDLGPLAPALPSAAPGVLTTWAVSGAITPGAPDAPPLRPDDAMTGPYGRAQALPGGLLELHRFVRLARDAREASAAARVRVLARDAGRRAFDLGFSDRATVFLNGEPLFRGEAGYSYEGRRDGLIGYEQARLYLPLRAGENELLIVVGDSFGGMGLMGRFPDPSGLTIVAP